MSRGLAADQPVEKAARSANPVEDGITLLAGRWTVGNVSVPELESQMGRRDSLTRIVILGFCLGLAVHGSSANAKCSGERYKVLLGQTISISKVSDGGRCVSKVGRSKDPIYGSNIVAGPKHGTLTTAGRTILVYRPQADFKGQDSYSFQWVGKQGGTTPSAMTVHVSVTVQ
jgi:hypothetical protein